MVEKPKTIYHTMDLTFYQNIKKYILEFLMVMISFSVIVFYLYWRISRKQPEIILTTEEIQKHYGVFLYFFVVSSFILLLLLLNIYLKRTLNALNEKKEVGLFRFFAMKIDKVLTSLNIFYKAYTICFHLINPLYVKPVITFASNILRFKKVVNQRIMFLFVVLPRVIISLIFIYEIYCQSLHFYFYSLLLLLIPLFFRFLLFVYNDIATQVLPKLNEVVERAPKSEKITITIGGETHTYQPMGFRFRPEYAYAPTGEPMDIDHFMFTFYNPMLFIGPHMEVKIMPLYSKYTTLTVLLYIGIQVLGWGYILAML